jgi:hypothetical protein
MDHARAFYEKQMIARSNISYIPLTDPECKGKLYLSGRNILNKYKDLHINHIISMVQVEKLRDAKVKHEIYAVEDYNTEFCRNQLTDVLDQIAASIHASLLAGVNVCVHCAAGISRSPTVVADYLYSYHQELEPLVYLRRYRSIINPNPTFVSLLKNRHMQ